MLASYIYIFLKSTSWEGVFRNYSYCLYSLHRTIQRTLAVGDVVQLEGDKGGRPLTEAQLLSAARRAYRTMLRPRVPLEPQKVGFTHGRRVRHV